MCFGVTSASRLPAAGEGGGWAQRDSPYSAAAADRSYEGSPVAFAKGETPDLLGVIRVGFL